MADAEWKAETQGDLGAIDQKVSPTDKGNLPKGTVWDLIIPIGGLIIFTILAMIYNGGYWTKPMTIQEAIGNCNSSAALVLGGFMALILAFIMFVPRKLLSFKDFMSNIATGINTMVPAYIILTSLGPLERSVKAILARENSSACSLSKAICLWN